MSFSVENFKHLLEPLNSISQRWAGDIYKALKSAQDSLDKIARRINSIETSITNLQSVFGVDEPIVVKRFFLTANLTVPLPDEPVGTIFLYVFEQDSTGGWTVTLPSEFVGMYAIPTTASTVSSYMFYKQDTDKMVPVMTGMGDVLVT